MAASTAPIQLLYMVFQCANNCAYLNHLWTRSLIWQLATVDSTSARDPSSEDALLLVQKRRRRHDAHRFCFSARRSRGRLSGVVCAPAAAVMPRRTCSPGDVAAGVYDMNPDPEALVLRLALAGTDFVNGGLDTGTVTCANYNFFSGSCAN